MEFPRQAVGGTLAVLQPGYLPWLGFFDQMIRADVFVLYDDVQYDKNGWRNRNRVKSQTGPLWLTVPVKNRFGQSIVDVSVDNSRSWASKQLTTITQLYKGAPYLERYLPEIESILKRDWDKLVDLDIAFIELMARWLHIETPILRSSQLGVGGDRNQRLVNLCLHFGVSKYYTGAAASCYLEEPLFAKEGISVIWQNYIHPKYEQRFGDFVPYLSTLDLILNCGDKSRDILVGR